MNKDQEEFERLRKRMYALADKMGQRLRIIVRTKNPFTGKSLASKSQLEDICHTKQQREPGDE